MANTKSRPKPNDNEAYIKTYNPVKSGVGKFVIVLLAVGMFLATLVAAILGMADVLG